MILFRAYMILLSRSVGGRCSEWILTEYELILWVWVCLCVWVWVNEYEFILWVWVWVRSLSE